MSKRNTINQDIDLLRGKIDVDKMLMFLSKHHEAAIYAMLQVYTSRQLLLMFPASQKMPRAAKPKPAKKKEVTKLIEPEGG